MLSNIRLADNRNKMYYDRRHKKEQVTLKFGDFVMVKTPRTTKLGPIAKGPFQFIRYLSKDCISAELIDPLKLDKRKFDGKTFITAKTFRENTSNLALVKVNRD